MATYQIEWKRSAAKELRKLSRDAIPRIVAAVAELGQNPTPQGVRKLVGSESSYRIRVGDYRIVYSVFRDVLIVEIVRVGHRKEVYR